MAPPANNMARFDALRARDRNRPKGTRGAFLDDDEGSEEDGRDHEGLDRRGGGPRVGARAGDGVDEGDQTTGHGDGAGDVERRAFAFGAGLNQHDAGRHQRGGGDGDVDIEDPAPRQQIGQDPTEERPRGSPDSRHGAPDPERTRPLGWFLERHGEDGQRGGGQHRRAQALQGARTDQHELVLRQGAHQAGTGEEQQTEHEDASAPEQVCGAAAQEQEAAEGQGVGIDHPLQARCGEAEVALHRGEGDVHDGQVEDDHELAHTHEGQDHP
jgi:hypothetical protein